MIEQTRFSLLFFATLVSALALANAQASEESTTPVADQSTGISNDDLLEFFDDEDEQVTAEQELEETLWEYDLVSGDCETLSQMLNETSSDPEASQTDKAEIEYALTGCLDILNAISLDIDELNQEIQEEASTNSTSSTTEATVAAN